MILSKKRFLKTLILLRFQCVHNILIFFTVEHLESTSFCITVFQICLVYAFMRFGVREGRERERWLKNIILGKIMHIFLGLSHRTQEDIFYFHSFASKFHHIFVFKS